MLTNCLRAILALAVVMAALAPIQTLRSDMRELGLPADVKAQLAATTARSRPMPSRRIPAASGRGAISAARGAAVRATGSAPPRRGSIPVEDKAPIGDYTTKAF